MSVGSGRKLPAFTGRPVRGWDGFGCSGSRTILVAARASIHQRIDMRSKGREYGEHDIEGPWWLNVARWGKSSHDEVGGDRLDRLRVLGQMVNGPTATPGCGEFITWTHRRVLGARGSGRSLRGAGGGG